jgi:hypothetical protein
VLYEPNTAEKLAEALTLLLLDPQAARQLGEQGRAGMLRAFSIEQTTADMVRLLDQIVQKA